LSIKRASDEARDEIMEPDRSSLLTGKPGVSFRSLFPQGLFCTGCASD